MREFKTTTVLILFLYYIYFVFQTQNEFGFWVISCLLFLFFIKYKMKNNIIKNSEIIFKTKLQKQRELFINILNHDLRIPVLAQIRGIELLNKNNSGYLNQYQQELINQINSSCRCVINMLSLLINTYNIENHTRKLYFEKFDLSELILASFNDLSEEAKEKNIKLIYNGTDKKIYLEADKTEIKNVILNLLFNSISHSKNGDSIFINTKISKKYIKITFGINKENVSVINPSDLTYTTIGTNIRMYFCKKVIEFHKGKIHKIKRANSFSFELPKEAIFAK